jgi:CDGSH-type Zn-finger protein
VTAPRVREMKTAVLCRCGHSSDQPFCDGTHVKIGFSDTGRLCAEPRGVVGDVGAGKLTITPIANGPNQCDGPLTIRDVEGRTCELGSTLLCRCGGSHHKPFCDGTHEKMGFKG